MTRTLVLSRVADELDLIRTELEQFGNALCSDPAVIQKHLTLLQSLDGFAQRHASLAMVLRASAPEIAADQVSLETQRLRLAADDAHQDG